MANKPFYEQEYHEQQNDVPNFKIGQILKTFFTKPFSWNARDTRKNFWVGYAAQFICEIILMAALALAMLPSYKIISDSPNDVDMTLTSLQPVTVIVGIIICILAIYLKLCLLGTAVRRLHDTDHEGWWVLLYFVPTFGWILVLYFMVIPTVEEPVRWGSYLEFK